MSDDVVLVRDAVSAQHVAAGAGNVEGLAAIVPLEDGDHLRDQLALVLQPAQVEARLEPKADLRQGVRHLLLDQLVLGQGPPELLPVHRVLSGSLKTIFCRSQGSPRNSIPGVIKATEWSSQTGYPM